MGHKVDIYHCGGHDNRLGSIIIRKSSEGSDYWSNRISCMDYSITSWEHGLAISAWVSLQEKCRWESDHPKKYVQEWCDFLNAGKLFKERFKIP